MLPAGICVVVALVVLWRAFRARPRPLDRNEVQILRHFADQIRKEQFHPFE